MRVRPWFLALMLATASSCGDGLGQPILGHGLVQAGIGGAGMAGGPAGSAGAAGAMGGLAAGAGLGGAAGNAGLGGSAGGRERPPPGTGLAPPWEEGDGGGSGTRPDGGGPPPSGVVPDSSYCREAADWEPGAEDVEWVIHDHLNFARTAGFGCGTSGGPPPPRPTVPPVAMSPTLRCAARLHSKAIGEGDDTGVGPEDRMRAAGAVFRVASETLGRFPPPGSPGPRDPLAAIFAAGGSQCENLVDPRFDSVGIGVYREFVTLDFTGP